MNVKKLLNESKMSFEKNSASSIFIVCLKIFLKNCMQVTFFGTHSTLHSLAIFPWKLSKQDEKTNQLSLFKKPPKETFMSAFQKVPVWTKASQMALSDSMTIELTVPSVICVQESRRPRRGTIGSYWTDCRRKFRQRKISSVVDSLRNPRAIRISSVVLCRLIWLLAAAVTESYSWFSSLKRAFYLPLGECSRELCALETESAGLGCGFLRNPPESPEDRRRIPRPRPLWLPRPPLPGEASREPSGSGDNKGRESRLWIRQPKAKVAWVDGKMFR